MVLCVYPAIRIRCNVGLPIYDQDGNPSDPSKKPTREYVGVNNKKPVVDLKPTDQFPLRGRYKTLDFEVITRHRIRDQETAIVYFSSDITGGINPDMKSKLDQKNKEPHKIMFIYRPDELLGTIQTAKDKFLAELESEIELKNPATIEILLGVKTARL